MARELLRDTSVPELMEAPPEELCSRRGVTWRAARWSPAALANLVKALDASGLREVSGEHLLNVWEGAIRELRDPESLARRQLDAVLPALCGLSPEGCTAALDTVLGGVVGESAAALARDAVPSTDRRPALVVLASNIPGLAAQPLLPALLARRPVVLKSSSAEPLVAPVLVEVLCQREPRLRGALAALTWPGGAHELEAPFLAAAGRVVAYGGGAALDDLAARAGAKLVGFGPMLSLAVVGSDVDPLEIADGLARDVALFDQRGCLSVQAVYTEGDSSALARELAAALERLAKVWPPGETAARQLAAVRALRDEALMRGLAVPELAVRRGTVVVESSAELRSSPGLRTVRVHRVGLDELPRYLEPWRGRLQGAALAGRAWKLAGALAELGVTRCAEPGALQRPDATWENGGLPPLTVFA